MVQADRLRKSHVANKGAIDQFGTVVIEFNGPASANSRDHSIRVYSPLLHRYAGVRYRAVTQGATLQVLDQQERIVARITYRQLEPTGPETTGFVLPGGYIVGGKSACAKGKHVEGRGSMESEDYFRALEIAGPIAARDQKCRERGQEPEEHESTTWIVDDRIFPRVASRWAHHDVIVFWLDEDLPVVFTLTGKPITPCYAERPLAPRTKNLARIA